MSAYWILVPPLSSPLITVPLALYQSNTVASGKVRAVALLVTVPVPVHRTCVTVPADSRFVALKVVLVAVIPLLELIVALPATVSRATNVIVPPQSAATPRHV